MTKRKLMKIKKVAFLVTGVPVSVKVQAVRLNLFRDIDRGDPNAGAIHYLGERGIVLADVNGYFYPAEPLSLTAALEIVERYLQADAGIAKKPLYTTTTFDEHHVQLTYEEAILLVIDFVKIITQIDPVEVMRAHTKLFAHYSEPYRQAVATLVSLQVPLHKDIHPQQAVTRGQFAFLLYNVIRLVLDTNHLPNLLQLDDFLLEQMEFTVAGDAAFGKGAVPGVTITVRNMYDDVIGTGFVQRDGRYQIPLCPAVTDLERITLILKDETNNRSAIEKTVHLLNSPTTKPVIVDFIIGSNEENPLMTSLEQFLHVASAFHMTDEAFSHTVQQARQMLADWPVTNNALLRQLDQVLYQLSDGLAPDIVQQVQQMLFVELKLIAESLQEEAYSKNSWCQLEKVLLQVDTLDMLFATQIQQAYYAFSKLVTTAQEEQQTIQGGFQELQETILVMETLLVETSVAGEEIAASEQWTTLEEKELLQQAVERALDVYIQFDPTMTEVLEAQSQLDLAIIRYEEAKRFGCLATEKITVLRAQLLGEIQHYSSKKKFSYNTAANKLIQKLNHSMNDAQ